MKRNFPDTPSPHDAPRIYGFEPYVFLFFGLFHIHRVWGLVDRRGYADFWLGVLEKKGLVYFVAMGFLALLCIAGIAVFAKNAGRNPRWRWIYVFGGGYVLFDLFAIATEWKIWLELLHQMFDTTSPLWNFLWGTFVLLGLLSFLLGVYLLRLRTKSG